MTAPSRVAMWQPTGWCANAITHSLVQPGPNVAPTQALTTCCSGGTARRISTPGISRRAGRSYNFTRRSVTRGEDRRPCAQHERGARGMPDLEPSGRAPEAQLVVQRTGSPTELEEQLARILNIP